MNLQLENLQNQIQKQLSAELETKLKRSLFVDNWAIKALTSYARNTKSLVNKLNKEYSKVRDILEGIEQLDKQTKQKTKPNEPKKKALSRPKKEPIKRASSKKWSGSSSPDVKVALVPRRFKAA